MMSYWADFLLIAEETGQTNRLEVNLYSRAANVRFQNPATPQPLRPLRFQKRPVPYASRIERTEIALVATGHANSDRLGPSFCKSFKCWELGVIGWVVAGVVLPLDVITIVVTLVSWFWN
jgi:hypothetical protein